VGVHRCNQGRSGRARPSGVGGLRHLAYRLREPLRGAANGVQVQRAVLLEIFEGLGGACRPGRSPEQALAPAWLRSRYTSCDLGVLP
jgi:hypothetical protein